MFFKNHKSMFFRIKNNQMSNAIFKNGEITSSFISSKKSHNMVDYNSVFCPLTRNKITVQKNVVILKIRNTFKRHS